MVDLATVRKLALALPEAVEQSNGGQISIGVGGKGFVWTYMQRVGPKTPRVARLDVVAIRCALERKELLIEAAPDIYFDDDHYRGYPAVLTRLAAIDEAELDAMLKAAWAMRAPRRLLKDRPPI